MNGMLLVFLGALLSVGTLAFALLGPAAESSRRLRRRAEGVRRRLRTGARSKAPGHASLKRDEGRKLPVLDALARRLVPRQSVLRDRLARTGRDISIGLYAAASVALAAVVLVLAAGAFKLPLAVSVAGAVVAGVGLPHLAVGWMAARRLKRFNDLFPDAIDLIVRGLKSGLPVTESITAVGREIADPVGKEFRAIADQVKFGQSLSEAMWDAARRLDTPEFKFFVISLSVQQETGGNLAETLANLSDILRRRRQMRLKIKAISSEARASATILGSLPFVMFCIIYLLNPDYEMILFNDERGRMVLGVGLTAMGIGILVMRKMVRFEI